MIQAWSMRRISAKNVTATSPSKTRIAPPMNESIALRGPCRRSGAAR
jgi:hypothetical protein